MNEPAQVELQDLSAPAAPGLGHAARPALQGINLRVMPGEQVAVIGASGAGKTSLLLALAAATRPLAGQLRWSGVDPWGLSPRERQRARARLFLAPQQPPLPPRQRVVTAVLAGLLPGQGLLASLASLWRPREAARAHAALQALGLGDKLWQRVDRLSGGERQRVGLARALVSDARLWLIDEPLSALDPERAALALSALQDHARREGRSLVCSLHQVTLARERFGRIVALQAGRVVYDGPSAGLDGNALQLLFRDEAGAPPAAPPLPDEPPRQPETLCR